MNTVALTINLPTGNVPPELYVQAIAQAVGEANRRGDMIASQALGGLLNVVGLSVASASRPQYFSPLSKTPT